MTGMDGIARVLQSLALSVDEVAASSRLPSDRVRALMEGAPANLPELRAIARALRLPMRAFALSGADDDRAAKLGLLFRGAVAESNRGQISSVETIANFVAAASKVLPAQQELIPWLSELMPREQTYAEAHRIARRFRSIFYSNDLYGPITNLPQVIISDGGLIIGLLRMSRYEGASVIADGYGFIFVSPRFLARMLFTVAHELGHIISHHGKGNAAVFDGASKIGAWRQQSVDERFVDTFASVLLLPEGGVALALQEIRQVLELRTSNLGDIQILYLARLFGVSFEVAARRCEQLELLPRGGAFSLAEALKKDFGSPEKRADQLGLPPRPSVFVPKVSDNLMFPIIEKIAADEISTGWAAEQFGLSIEEIFDAHVRLKRARRD